MKLRNDAERLRKSWSFRSPSDKCVNSKSPNPAERKHTPLAAKALSQVEASPSLKERDDLPRKGKIIAL
jgi:hypothetical protein